MLWLPEGRRRKGRPKMKWKHEIEDYASFLWRRKAQNRKLWKSMGESFVQYRTAMDLK